MRIRVALLAGVAMIGALVGTAPVATAATGVEIVNAGSSDYMCLDAENDPGNSPTHNGDKVQLWSCLDTSNQRWIFKANSLTWGTIVNENGNKCLDAKSDPPNSPGLNGDGIQLWTCNGSYAQKWMLVPLGNGLVGIYNQAGGLVLDAENDKANNPSHDGDKIQLWSELDPMPGNQQWSAG